MVRGQLARFDWPRSHTTQPTHSQFTKAQTITNKPQPPIFIDIRYVSRMKIDVPFVLCHCLCFFYFREFVTSLILRMWNKTSHNIWKSHLLGRPLSNWTLSEQKTRQVAEGVGAGDGKRWMCHRVPLCRLRNPSHPRTTRDPGQPNSRAYPDPTKKHHNESVLYY